MHFSLRFFYASLGRYSITLLGDIGISVFVNDFPGHMNQVQ